MICFSRGAKNGVQSPCLFLGVLGAPGGSTSFYSLAFEFLSTKVGLVLLILGGMHFFNVFNFAKIRRKGRAHEARQQTPLTAMVSQPDLATVAALREVRER
jgi:hypothetical protein